MKKALRHRAESFAVDPSTSTERLEVLASKRSGIRLLLMVITVSIFLASTAFAGKVAFTYDALGQLESVRNNADKNILSGSISTGVSNKRLFLRECFDVFRTVRGRLLTMVCDTFYLTRVTWTMSV